MKSLTFAEMDLDYCSRVYGTAPCAAAQGIAAGAAWDAERLPVAVALSSENRLATKNASDGEYGNVFSAQALPEYCVFDVQFSLVFIGAAGVGNALASVNGTGNPGEILGFDANSIGYFSNGLVVVGGAVVATLSGYGLTSTLRVAVNATTRRIWFREMPSGLWNDSATADPAKGVGGISIAAITGDLYGAAGLPLATDTARLVTATGARKCFNTLATCQDRLNFDNTPVTLRFAMPTEYLPKEIEAIPSLRSVSLSPAVISLGENLGQRATLTLAFDDHPHSDTGAGGDKYLADRHYAPFSRGSFWGKFRVRQAFVQGRPLRVIRGRLGQSLAEMETRHYVLENFDGPSPAGVFSLTAKDVLKLADDDRAQAPRLSNGFLVAEIDDAETAATLSPSGIGALEYPTAGFVAIGGNEICAFTRVGDVLTLTRGQLGTAAAAHDEQDRVQLCLVYEGVDPADIVADLLENYAGVPGANIPLSAWQTETASFLQRVYSAVIAEPTGVNKLVSELVEQAALVIWWDDLSQTVRLQVLRGVASDAESFTPENTIENSLRASDQPQSRLSQVWTFFGQINPLKSLDDEDNFRSVAATIELEAQSDYGAPAIRKIYSRWIPAFGRTVATRLNALILARFKTPPRRFSFELFRRGPENPALGGGYRLRSWVIQDDTGAAAATPIQITRLDPRADKYVIEAEEMLAGAADPADLLNRVLIIDANTLDFNLRAAHDSIYPEIVDPTGVTLTCIVEDGVRVGASATSLAAFMVGDWPDGLAIEIEVRGRVQGHGGRGGNKTSNGLPGGVAFYTRHPVNMDFTGEIWAGGGGGGGGGNPDGGGGGGGAGFNPGPPGTGSGGAGEPGTPEEGGQGDGASSGVRGGQGGDPGFPGEDGNGISAGDGGLAGAAIDGASFVTRMGAGDLRGSEIN